MASTYPLTPAELLLRRDLGSNGDIGNELHAKVDRVKSAVDTVDGYFDVPTVDATTNTTLRDVVGNKADASVVVVGAEASVQAYVKGVLTTALLIKTDTGNIEVDTQDLQASVKLIESKDGGLTFDRATDSLEALSEVLAGLVASSTSLKLLQAKKASGAIAQGANELVTLSTAQGVSSPYNLIKEIRVVPTTNTCTDFTVEIFEDSAATLSLMRYTGATSTSGDLRLAQELVFINQNSTPNNNIYVKITNVADTTTSIFNVEVRGHILSV